jgi:hypothetical protein
MMLRIRYTRNRDAKMSNSFLEEDLTVSTIVLKFFNFVNKIMNLNNLNILENEKFRFPSKNIKLVEMTKACNRNQLTSKCLSSFDEPSVTTCKEKLTRNRAKIEKSAIFVILRIRASGGNRGESRQ